jgi:hypothetical protein
MIAFLGDAECICPRFHLFPDFGWLDADVKPEDDQVIEQVGAFAHHAGGIAFDGLDRDLARLLDQFSGDLVPARLQQLERARVVGGCNLIKRACKIFQHARIGRLRISCRSWLPAVVGMKVGGRQNNAVGLAVARVNRKCFGRSRAGAAPRSCPDAVACADFFHGSPLCRSLRRRGEPDAKRLRCFGRNELALPSLCCDPHRGSRHGACAPQRDD